MYLYQFVMPKDDEYKVSDTLGQRNIVHFIDLNPEEHHFKLSYINIIKRCEEAERRVCSLVEFCKQYRIPLTSCESIAQLNSLTSLIAENRQMVSL
jgi:V-type ATPase 116kDa subunit family